VEFFTIAIVAEAMKVKQTVTIEISHSKIISG
jgi:hypothetical protein